MLTSPDDDPGEATEDEEDVPEPEDEVDLVYDDVEAEDTEGVESSLPSPRAVLVVGAAGHSGEGLTPDWSTPSQRSGQGNVTY